MFKEKLIGILLCKLDETGIDLYACHTTSSMCYAFMSSNMNEPLVIFAFKKIFQSS